MLEEVARGAGYTRGALYHQFRDKEDLARAVVKWVDETWRREVGGPVEQETEPVAALIAVARGNACSPPSGPGRDALRVEFRGDAAAVGGEVERRHGGLVSAAHA